MLMIDFIFTFVFVFQIDWVCQKLLADPLMADGYNAIGISQGGLLVRFDMPWETQWLVVNVLKRGLVQRCPLPVKNLITFGSPHQVDLIKHLRRHNIPRSLSLKHKLFLAQKKKKIPVSALLIIFNSLVTTSHTLCTSLSSYSSTTISMTTTPTKPNKC